MIARRLKTLGFTALAATLAFPAASEAQLGRIDFGLAGPNAWVAYADGRLGVTLHYGGGRFNGGAFVPVNGIRVPRGHRPGRGFCRLWYPGVRPGHQPRAVRCSALRGPFGDGVLVVTHRGVLRPVWDRAVRRHWGSYRDARIIHRDRRGRYWYDRDDFWWDDRYDDWDDRYGDWDDWDDDRWEDRRDRWEDRRDRERDRREEWRDRERDRREDRRDRRLDRRDNRRDRGLPGRGNGRGNGRGPSGR